MHVLCARRLRIDNRELEYRGGGLFGSNPLTGSIGVVTVNLPRIGYLSNNEAEFFRLLCKNMEIARESLEIKKKSYRGIHGQKSLSLYQILFKRYKSPLRCLLEKSFFLLSALSG